jgi:L-lysine 6-oxidase
MESGHFTMVRAARLSSSGDLHIQPETQGDNQMAVQFKIHPSIGFARVGNSPDKYFLPPEILGGPRTETVGGSEVPVTEFKDNDGRLKRGGVRFRLFRYDDTNPNGVEVSLNDADIASIEWTVHVANKKAIWFEFDGLTGETGYAASHPRRNQSVINSGSGASYIIDPGPRTVSSAGEIKEFRRGTAPTGYPETFPPPLIPKPVDSSGNSVDSIDTLGEIRMDHGRLVFLPGLGHSGTLESSPHLGTNGILDYVNNDRWFDDVCDGPVTARVSLADGTTVEADAAWVVVGPPDYAPELDHAVTLYDVVYDLAVREMNYDATVYHNGSYTAGFTPSFREDVEPLLKRAFGYRWVYNDNDPDSTGRAPRPTYHRNDTFFHASLSDPNGSMSRRNRVFRTLREPGQSLQDTEKMPLLWGDTFPDGLLSLTTTQYEIMRRWKDGTFETGMVPPSALMASGLDRASLEQCSGGAFYPGMEVTWLIRNRHIFSQPFRIKHKHSSPPDGLEVGDHNEDVSLGLEAGDLTKRMAIPWQADFLKCSKQHTTSINGPDVPLIPWWPAQRPIDVITDSLDSTTAPWIRGVTIQSHVDLVKFWYRLGLIVPSASDPTVFVEDERDLGLPGRPRPLV